MDVRLHVDLGVLERGGGGVAVSRDTIEALVVAGCLVLLGIAAGVYLAVGSMP